ncbi:MAG: DUF4037 domain-containing protein [Spirochaetaceae bacterium]|nr:DUF4037 domain-containing protein [Spirochaetaceae bacterium]
MNQKVERIADSLTRVISGWANVECVSLCEQAEVDVLDPYFALVIDVHHRGGVPPAEERRAAFGDPGAFESASNQSKDRFFLEGLPIRVEYKSVQQLESLMDGSAESLWILKNSGTYLLYRLETAQVLWKRSDWIDGIRRRLAEMPAELWNALRGSFQSKMEHYLADLGAAAVRDDGFFYLVSSGGFAKYAAATLFMINRRFEPSHRLIDSHLRALKRVPDDFFGRWETFLRSDIEMSREQKHRVAELLAKSIVAFR